MRGTGRPQRLGGGEETCCVPEERCGGAGHGCVVLGKSDRAAVLRMQPGIRRPASPKNALRPGFSTRQCGAGSACKDARGVRGAEICLKRVSDLGRHFSGYDVFYPIPCVCLNASRSKLAARSEGRPTPGWSRRRKRRFSMRSPSFKGEKCVSAHESFEDENDDLE